ncbi:MAG TPA: GWxTD domain-containing protein [Terracidiphilus sp.]|nr:GWxTD domain-containing protein [Terracidiphilus sp.]
MRFSRRTLLSIALGSSLIAAPAYGRHSHKSDDQAAQAQADSGQNTGQDSGKSQQANPLKRKRTVEEKFKADKALHQELSSAYKNWLDKDVVYIITDQERKAFLNLSNDEEREAFIEQFWARRNPDPDSPDNTYREEHYRRIAYANEHFAAGKPGWKTDRGRIYIEYGPPDSIDSHPSGGSYERPMDEGGGETSTFPFEDWHYRYIPGIGENINLEFVDTCQCGDYHFTIDRSEKDALLHVPGAGLTWWEQIGMAKKADRFKGGTEDLGLGPMQQGEQSKEFDRIELAAKIFAPPKIKFADLDNFISEHKVLSGPVFPFDVRTDFVKVTDSMVLVPITLQIKNRDVTFVTKDGVSKGVVDILGKVTTITHKVVQTFEDTVEVEQPAELLQQSLNHDSVYWKALPLAPGLYRLDIAIKDANNPDHIGIYGRALDVPEFHDEKLETSSLILADKMNPVDSHSIGSGSFVIGSTFIRPRVANSPGKPVTFKRDQELSFWMQIYNLGINDATKSNNATVTYEIVDANNEDVLLQKQLESKDLEAHSDQLTVEKSLSVAGLQPGKYKVLIKVNDEISKQGIAQSAPFVVE